jgi:L-aspartate oxidase
VTADFLIIGSGIAGLSLAIRAAQHGKVICVTKGALLDSNTAWAQGGISSVLPEGLRDHGDNCELHIADTLDAGAGLCHESVVRTIVEEGANTIDDLVGYGVDFDKEGDHFSLGKEGGHSKRRILHARDTTGREIAEALVATAIGLFAAIPAVLAYNRFSRDIERVAIRLDTFMEEFSNILQRNVGSQSTSGH